jgi:hypothetical protein
MESVLTSRTPDRYQGARHLKLTDRTPIPLKYHKVLAMHLAGKPVGSKDVEGSICQETGYAPATVYKILADERVVQIRQQLLNHTQTEFEALYPAVVNSLRKDLLSGQPDRENRARDQWLHAAGKYQSGSQSTNVTLTAEDIVVQILNQPVAG